MFRLLLIFLAIWLVVTFGGFFLKLFAFTFFLPIVLVIGVLLVAFVSFYRA